MAERSASDLLSSHSNHQLQNDVSFEASKVVSIPSFRLNRAMPEMWVNAYALKDVMPHSQVNFSLCFSPIRASRAFLKRSYGPPLPSCSQCSEGGALQVDVLRYDVNRSEVP